MCVYVKWGILGPAAPGHTQRGWGVKDSSESDEVLGEVKILPNVKS